MKVHLMDGVKRGKDITTRLPGKRSGRLSIIGALCSDNFFAPMVYQGYCTAKVIETWLEKCLLPKVQIGQVIVMDNAPFHSLSSPQMCTGAQQQQLFSRTLSLNTATTGQTATKQHH